MEEIGFGHSFGTVKSRGVMLEGRRERELRARALRFKTNFEPRPGRLGVFFKRSRRGHASAAFQTRDHGLRGLHTLRHLLLREAGAGAGFDHRGGK